MKAHIENEIKLRVETPAKARSLLRRAGFTVRTPRVFEQNIVLDDARDSLRARGMLLRLRAAGKIVTCTFKGPEMPGPHKRREEREFRAWNLPSCTAVFAALGYGEVFRYEKYRTEFKSGNSGIATLDETPIGAFIELEGSARWVDRTAKLFGFLPGHYITASYGQLYQDWCRTQKIAPSNMTFDPK